MSVKKKTTAKKKEVKHCTCGADEEPLLELNGSTIEEITLIIQWDHFYDKTPYPYSLEDALVGELKQAEENGDGIRCPETDNYLGKFKILKSGSRNLALRRTEPCNRALVEEGSVDEV